jgi:hypothetical protein
MDELVFPSKRFIGFRVAHLWKHCEAVSVDLDPNGGFNPWLFAIVLTGGLYVHKWLKSDGLLAPKRRHWS